MYAYWLIQTLAMQYHCAIQTDLSYRGAVYSVPDVNDVFWCTNIIQVDAPLSSPCTSCNSKIYLPLDLLRDLQCPLHYRWWGYGEHSSLWSFIHIAFIFHLVGPPIAVPSSYFGTATGPILLSGVQCNGSELQLTSCPKASSALISFCNHGFDVGVICHGEFGTY